MWKVFEKWWASEGKDACEDIFKKHGGLKASVEYAFIHGMIQHEKTTRQGDPVPNEATLRVSFDLALPASVSQIAQNH